MADKKISQLPAATTPLAGTEVLPIVQSGTTVKVSVDNLTAGKPVSCSSLTVNAGNLVIGTSGKGITSVSNGNIQVTPNGTGSVVIGAATPQISQERLSILLTDNIGQGIYCTNSTTYASTLNFWRGDRNTTNSTWDFLRCYNNGYKLYIRDSGNIENANNSYGAISDEKLKQDIVDATSQWNDIKSIRVRKYHFKTEPDAPLQIGVIAQELEQTSPGLVAEHEDCDDKGEKLGTKTKTVKYSILYMKAIKALQEAMERIEILEAKVLDLQNK